MRRHLDLLVRCLNSAKSYRLRATALSSRLSDQRILRHAVGMRAAENVRKTR